MFTGVINIELKKENMMKKFLENVEFEDYFEYSILSRGQSYYNENRIRDIWYQKDNVYAYIDGSEIYKVELEIKNGEIQACYCSCPYSEGGEFMCKHIAAVLYYLVDNEVPELEVGAQKSKRKNKSTSELNKIYAEMQYELKNISDKDGFVNYYNGRYFVDLISRVTYKIEKFIDEENFNNAFELIKHTYFFIKDTFMDGSNGEYQDSLYMLCSSTSKLLYEDEYYKEFLKWANTIASNNELGDFSDAPLYAFILYVHDKNSAQNVIKILDNCQFSYGIFVNCTLDKISLVYDYIDKDEAIKICYQNVDIYGVKDLLIKYLKDENKIQEIVKMLKDDIKNHVRKDMAYDKLIEVYDENNMLQEKKEILPEVIIETNDFKRYKELKNLCNISEWKNLKEEIISKIKSNNRGILENIYAEENEPDKLFGLIKKDPDLAKLYDYQNVLKDKYSKELLDFYKLGIIEKAKWATDRERYRSLCKYIKKMNEINDSSLFIYNMIEEMYPLYRNRKAFKEEIMNVLNSENKVKFVNLITNKMEVK